MKKIMILCLLLSLLTPMSVQAESDLTPNADAAILMEASQKEILYAKNENEKMYPASTTKIMTLILIFEAINNGTLKLDDPIRTSAYAASMGGSQVFLEEGEVLQANEMIKSIVIASANDCCVAMAEYLEGSSEAFVQKMNDKAQELGLNNTHFVNCTGLHDDNHYTTAKDLALMASYLIDIGETDLMSFTTMYDAYIRDGENKFWLVNTNKLINQYDGADGLKTGFTKEAGYCLVATAKRNGVRMISVVLNEKEAKVRNQESMKMLDYGFNQYTTTTLYHQGDVITELDVPNSKEKRIPLTTLEDIVLAVKKGQEVIPDYSIEVLKHQAPIAQGEEVAQLVVYHEKQELQRFPLVAASQATPLSFSEWIYEIYRDLLLA